MGTVTPHATPVSRLRQRSARVARLLPVLLLLVGPSLAAVYGALKYWFGLYRAGEIELGYVHIEGFVHGMLLLGHVTLAGLLLGFTWPRALRLRWWVVVLATIGALPTRFVLERLRVEGPPGLRPGVLLVIAVVPVLFVAASLIPCSAPDAGSGGRASG